MRSLKISTRVGFSYRRISGWLFIASVTCGALLAQNATDRPAGAASEVQRALLDKYCVTCHNAKSKIANLLLDKVDIANVGVDAAVWEKVIRKLQASAMPPAGLPRPDKAAYDSLISYLETSLDAISRAHPNPGMTPPHRLNRAEYANAVRDLLNLEIDAAALLPEDDSGYGFDNNGDVLSVSAFLLDRYISASRQISHLAVGDPTLRLPVSTYNVPPTEAQSDTPTTLPFGSRGGFAIRHNFAVDGEYIARIRLQYLDKKSITELTEPHELDFRLDGSRVKLFSIGGKTGSSAKRDDLNPEENTDAGLEIRFTAKAGVRTVGVTFLDEGTLSEGMERPPYVELKQDGQGPKVDSMSDPGIANVAISGPYNATGVSDTPSRRKIFVCHPAGKSDEEICARRILGNLARRAYRRPVADSDIKSLLVLYNSGRDDGFESGISRALQGILLSKEFLFRVDRDPVAVKPNTPYRISDVELASRLSFFLWSSIPDDELLKIAETGRLKNPEILEQQVRRMLADPRASALVSNFGAEWFNLRNMQTLLPDRGTFPDFDDDLRSGLAHEMDLFLQDNLSQDHNVLDLLRADYTFVNERLARYYGIPNIYGNRFRRVTLADENRWGLLGKGAVLTVTSYPLRTSPVERGKWVLENILGTPPPQPPPNVPPLPESRVATVLTMRQRMEQHRANPACASCHARMDPIGFALENYDAIGKWRTTEGGKPIDTSGTLPDGRKFSGPAEFRKILVADPGLFLTLFTEKLLTYALGRGAEYYDEPAVREILQQASTHDYRWSAFVSAVVRSVPFQMRLSAEPAGTSRASLR